jgi:hypothetical protein
VVNPLNEDTELTIPIKNLIALVIATAVAVWAYFGVESRLNVAEREIVIMSDKVEQNTNFRILWPRGELGSLPDDMMQNAKLETALDRVKELEKWVNNFQPPPEVRDTVTRVRVLEKKVAELGKQVEHLSE